MPILSSAQAVPMATQVATLRTAIRLSAAQTMPAAGQAATISAPKSELSAAQTMAPFQQTMRFRLVRGRVRGLPVPREPGSTPTPRE